MSTENESQEAKKPLTLNRPKKLELKKTVETGQVRQSFSHGRTKTVQVEVKRKRTYRPGDGGGMTAVAEEAQAPEEAETLQQLPQQRVVPPALRNLRPEEREARMRALEHAKEETARREVEDAERRKREAAEAEGRRLEAEDRARREADEAVRRQAEGLPEETAEEARAAEAAIAAAKEAEAAAPEPAPMPTPKEVERITRPTPKAREVEDEGPRGALKKKTALKAPPPTRTKNEPKRRQGKLTITQALDDEGNEDRIRSLAAVRRQREREKQRAREQLQSGQKIVREVTIPEAITVQELANRMAERGGEVVKTLMKMGVMATITQSIDADTAELVVGEFGHRSKRVSAQDVEIGLRGTDDDGALLQPRAPVVTVMGHVDHGKTSLLDAMRKTDVAAHEAGGITQHIGAYQIVVPSGDKITFLDTPGHAAFSEMRSRGANVTDIVILVVAANDGIMAQTVEAISHAKAAGVPIIVAINKMDVPGADPRKVKTALLQHELVPEDMGGDVICVEVSAKTREGLDNLIDVLLLQAELLELKANPDRNAEGTVVEAKLEQGRGAVATVLIQRGTLKVGDIFVAGAESGRVRALLNDRGERVDSAGPSVPVEVIGLSGTPEAGDDLVVVDDEARAREIADFRADRKKSATMATQGRGTLEQMLSAIREGAARTMPLVVKADVHGSLEAILGALDKMATDEVRPEILHSAVGGINESDVTLARASGAMILAFNVRANAQARDLAKRDSVDIRYYSIIYELIDEMRKALGGLLAPEQREVFLGYAEIREVFNITKVGKVAGCMITEGVVKRGAKVRLLRDDVVIHAGTLKTLKRFKDEVREVQQGYECGMAFEHYEDIAVGDRIECYEVEEVARTL